MPVRRREGALEKAIFKEKERMHVGRQPSAAWGKRGRETMARMPPVKGCGEESAGVRPVKALSPLPSSVVAGPGAEKEAGGVCVCFLVGSCQHMWR